MQLLKASIHFHIVYSPLFLPVAGSLKAITNKHTSSSSTVQQMADVGRQFVIMKTENKTRKYVNLPSAFGRLDNHYVEEKLTLNVPTRKVIIDHVVSCLDNDTKPMYPQTT